LVKKNGKEVEIRKAEYKKKEGSKIKKTAEYKRMRK
jgi:hypothetical protein